MAITPDALREATFRWAPLRGYHPDDVDEFLERMAAGIELLTQRVREAMEAAVRAEQAALDEALPEDDDAMTEVILASQKAADAALEVARSQASEVLARADAYARALVEEAAAATDRTRRYASLEAEADLRRLRGARDLLRVEAIAAEQHVLAHPLPTATPRWPACLHAVEQGFPAPTH